MCLLSLVIQFKSARQTEVDNESKKKYCTEQGKSEASSSIGNVILYCLIPELTVMATPFLVRDSCPQ